MKSDENLMKLAFHQIFIRFHQIFLFLFFLFFLFQIFRRNETFQGHIDLFMYFDFLPKCHCGFVSCSHSAVQAVKQKIQNEETLYKGFWEPCHENLVKR